MDKPTTAGTGSSGMEKVAAFIVDKRNLFFLGLCSVHFQETGSRLKILWMPICPHLPKQIWDFP